jgi:hypothetical protein
MFFISSKISSHNKPTKDARTCPKRQVAVLTKLVDFLATLDSGHGWKVKKEQN